jgi:hypothetical protein
MLHFALINLVGPLVAIASVERMILANDLTTSGIRESTGQMIALFTGVSTFCLACWELGKYFLQGPENVKPVSQKKSKTPQLQPSSRLWAIRA